MIGFFPWSVFVIQSITAAFKKVWRNRIQHQTELFLLLWLFIIFIFFSLPKSKTIGYILPIFPVLALLTGHYLSTIWKTAETKGVLIGKRSFIIVCGLAALTCLLVPHAKTIIRPALFPYIYYTGAIFFIAGIVATYLLRKKSNLSAFFYCFIMTACVFALILLASTPAVNRKSIKPLALELKAKLKPDDEVVTYFKYYQDLPIYIQRRITIVADWHAADIPRYDNWLRELWYGMPFQNTKEWLIDEKTFHDRWNSSKRLFVMLNMNYYQQFSSSIKSPIYKLDQHNEVVLVSNKEN